MRRWGRRLWLALLAMLIPLGSMGCQRNQLEQFRSEISDMALVLAVGVDYLEESGQYRLTVISQSTSGGSSEEAASAKSVVTSSSGRTVSEAVSRMMQYADSDLFFGHTEYVLLGEDVFNGRLLQVMDVFVRDIQFRLDNSLLVVYGQSAESFIRDSQKEEAFLTDRLDNLTNTLGTRSATREVRLTEALYQLQKPHAVLLLPYVATVCDEEQANSDASGGGEESAGKNAGSESKEESSGGGSQGQDGSDEESEDGSGSSSGESSAKESSGGDADNGKFIYLGGYAVVDDKQFYGYTDEETALGINWFTGKVNSTVQVVQDDKGYPISLTVTQANAQYDSIYDVGGPVITVHIKVRSNISEIYGELNIYDDSDIERIEATQCRLISDQIQRAVDYVRENGLDILVYNEILYHQLNDYWPDLSENWEQVLQHTTVRTDITCQIVGTYQFGNPQRRVE